MKTDKKEPAMTQRTPEEMMNLILSRAENDAHIRVVGMEGSRTNQNIPKDRFQDFDVTYFVDDPALYTEDDTWVNVFGERLIMQKPEDMELFPAVEDGYSFLMFFTDYNKIDLTILPLTALEDYLNGDGLREILLDKDGRVEEKPTPTDKEYHIQKPGARSFDDCCNEFWNITIYVVKGLCRRELLFAIDLLAMMRNELLRMISPQSSGKRFFPRIAQILWKTHGGRFSPATSSSEMLPKISPQNTATPIPITTKTSPATSAICTRNTKQNNASPQKSLQNSPKIARRNSKLRKFQVDMVAFPTVFV